MRKPISVFLLLALGGAIAPAAQLPYLVKDLNTDARGAYGSAPFNFAAAGDRAYFTTQSNLDAGYSIWTTDGSSDGTRRVAAFSDCWLSGYADGPILEPIGNLTFFVERCGGEAWEQRLWRSDATEAGTYPLAVELAEVHTGAGYSIQEGSWTRAFHGRFYFGARTAAESDLELWSSDGTEEGTSRLAALPSPAGSWVSFSARAGDRLIVFIQQNTYEFLTDVWSTDGTAGGTRKLASLKLGHAPAVTSGESLLYFSALDPGDPWDQAYELWVTDGTSSGTRMLTHFTPEPSLSACSLQARIVGDELLFCASTSAAGTQVWRSDGTIAGTFPLSAFGDIYPFAYSAYRVEATKLAGSYYFLGFGEDNAYSLWRSEGTPGAAVRVRRIASAEDYLEVAPWLEQVEDRLVFWGFADGWKPFGSDGTAAGTFALAETCPGSCPPFAGSAGVVGDRLLFVALDDERHQQLWSTQGTAQSTFRLSDDIQDLQDGSSRDLIGAAIGGDWLFPARDAATGFEPWAANPARPLSAYRVRDLVPDTPGIRLAHPNVRGSELAFSVREDFHFGDFGVYRTDGTGAGTLEIARIGVCGCGLGCVTGPATPSPLPAGIVFDDPEDCDSPSLRAWNRSSGEVHRLFGGPGGERPGEPELFPLGDAALVFLSHGGTSTEIWRTDGSDEGTTRALGAVPHERIQPFSDLGTGLLLLTTGSHFGLRFFDPALDTVLELPSYTSSSHAPQYPSVVGHSAYFFVYADPLPNELWRSDGTVAGTLQFMTLPAGHELASEFFELDGSALFAIDNWETGLQLWTSDGTPSGTLLLRSFADGRYGMADLGTIGHRALFGIHTFDASTGIYRSELWQTDGTGEGTGFLANLEREGRPEYIRRFVKGSSALYFETTNEDFAVTLWATDGTPAGTRALWSDATLNYGLWWTSIQPTPFGTDLVFVGASAGQGRELRVLDTTLPGSHLLVDLRPGPESSAPQDLTAAADRLYFTADDGLHGRELWALLSVGAEPCIPSETALCLLGGRYRLELASGRGAARALPLTATTGGFAFAGGDEPDAFFKLIDGSAVNRNHWLFGAGLEPEAFTLRVTDTADGSSKVWTAAADTLASFGDIDAFPYLPPAPFAAGPAPAGGESPTGGCPPVSNRLCFDDGRYLVEATTVGWDGASSDRTRAPSGCSTQRRSSSSSVYAATRSPTASRSPSPR